METIFLVWAENNPVFAVRADSYNAAQKIVKSLFDSVSGLHLQAITLADKDTVKGEIPVPQTYPAKDIY